jgi:Fe-S oxidoreductase
MPPPPSLRPTAGSTTDPDDPRYWDEDALGAELGRAFEICAGCRLCFKYCDAFPKLFASADDRHDGDARALDAEETAAVTEACFECKLCEVSCPYTPREGHPFALDFPKLVHRARAGRARRRGLPLRARLLGNPEALGRLARLSGGLANRLALARTPRAWLEKALGIHRAARLPPFARRTFTAWADRAGLCRPAPGGEAVLFPSCMVDNNAPELGRDAVEVLRRNAVDVRCTRGLACCGMPAWESGDLPALRRRARRNLDRLGPFVEAGALVIALAPTCGLMLRREYPELVAAADRPRARKLAAAVRDPCELLWGMRREPRFDRGFASLPERVAYHAPCHLRAQGAGLRARDLLRDVGVADVALVAECCGHDGSHGVKVETFDAARRAGAKAFAGMRAAGPATWVTDCPLAALQLEQHTGQAALHPLSLLARAYRGEAFPASATGGPRTGGGA